MSDNNTTKKKPRGGSGRIIGVILVMIILLLICFPDLCFFLNAPQKEALKLFNVTYLGKYIPMRTESGGFDFMRLVALVIMIAGCWAVYRILMWIMSLIKAGTRRGETLKGMLSCISVTPDYRSEQEKTLPDPARVSCFSPAARE